MAATETYADALRKARESAEWLSDAQRVEQEFRDRWYTCADCGEYVFNDKGWYGVDREKNARCCCPQHVTYASGQAATAAIQSIELPRGVDRDTLYRVVFSQAKGGWRIVI